MPIYPNPAGFSRDASGNILASAPVVAPNLQALPPHAPRSGRLALLGSSIQAYGTGATVGTMQTIGGKCAAVWIDVGRGNIYSPVVFGYSTQSTDVIRSHLTEVLAISPEMVILEYGMNNVRTAADVDVDLPKLQADVETVIDSGATPVAWFPHVSTPNGNSAGACAYNILGQEWALSRSIPFVSGLWAICDRASLACTPASGALLDGLNPTTLGARLIGDEISEMLRSGGNGWRILPCGSAQTPLETFANPRMIGSTATTEGSWISGNKPPSWIVDSNLSAAGTVVSSVGSDAEGPYWDLAMTFAALGDYVGIGESASHFSKMLAGKTYRGYLDFEIISGAANLRLGQIFLPAQAGMVHFPMGSAPDYQSGTLTNKRYRFRSYPVIRDQLGGSWQWHPGARFHAAGAGSATVRVRGISLRESRW